MAKNKCWKIKNPQNAITGEKKSTSTPNELDGRIKSIYKVSDEKEVGSKDSLLTNAQKGANFFEHLNRPEAKVVLKQMNFSDKQIGLIEGLIKPSFELARKFKPFNDAQQIALTAQENREQLTNRWKTDGEGNLRKILLLDRSLVPDFTSVVVEADRQQINFSEEALKKGIVVTDKFGKPKPGVIKLNDDQINAFKEHKKTTDLMLSDLWDSLDYVTMMPFHDKPFIQDLKNVIEKKSSGRVYETFGENVLKIIQTPSDTLRSTNPEINKLIGKNYSETVGNLDKIVDIVLAEDPAFNLTEADIPSNLSKEQKDDFARTYKKLISRKASIQVLRKQMGTQEFYFPRFRGDGKYILLVKAKRDSEFDIKKEIDDGFSEPEDIKYYKRFDSVKERTKEAAELEREFPSTEFDIVIDTQEKVSEYQFQNLSDGIIEQFLDRSLKNVKNGKIITQEQYEELREAMISSLTEDLKTRGFGRQMIQRKGEVIAGYDTENYKKSFNTYANGLAGFVTKQVASLEYAKVLRETKREPTREGKGRGNLYDEVHRFAKDMLRNQTNVDRISGKLRSFAFVWYLAGQLRTPMVNLTQNFVLGIPELSKFTKKADIKYMKAMVDMARLKAHQIRGMKGTVKGIDQDIFDMLAELRNRGVVGAAFAKDAVDLSKSQLGEAAAKTINLLAKPFAFTEELNRESAALAMLRVCKAEGKSRSECINQARKFVLDTHFAFGRENLQAAARAGTTGSAIVRTGLTFKTFSTNYIFALSRAFGEKEVGMLGRVLAYTILLGGVSAVPYLDSLMNAIEKYTGKPYRQIVKNELKGAGGDYLANFGTRGLPAMMGVDISNSLRLQLPTEGTPTKIASETAFGIWGSLQNSIVNGFSEAIRGRYLRAFENIVPAVAKGPIRAGREAVEGITTFSGKPILDEFGNTISPTKGEVAIRATGFQPSRLSEVATERRQRINITIRGRKKRQNLIDDFNSAKTQEKRRAVVDKIKEFNRSNIVQGRLVKPIRSSSLGKRKQRLKEETIAFQRAKL